MRSVKAKLFYNPRNTSWGGPGDRVGHVRTQKSSQNFKGWMTGWLVWCFQTRVGRHLGNQMVKKETWLWKHFFTCFNRMEPLFCLFPKTVIETSLVDYCMFSCRDVGFSYIPWTEESMNRSANSSWLWLIVHHQYCYWCPGRWVSLFRRENQVVGAILAGESQKEHAGWRQELEEWTTSSQFLVNFWFFSITSCITSS